MELWSPAFESGDPLPAKHTRDGENVSPPLEWSDIPTDAEELVVVLENLTPSTSEPDIQWVVFGVSPDAEGLPEGLGQARQPQGEEGIAHGRNYLGNVGYDGPQGVVGRRLHLRFRLMAVDTVIDLDAGADADDVIAVAEEALVDEATLPVVWERPRPREAGR